MIAKYTDGLLWDEPYDNDSTERKVYVPQSNDLESVAIALYERDAYESWDTAHPMVQDSYMQEALVALKALGIGL